MTDRITLRALFFLTGLSICASCGCDRARTDLPRRGSVIALIGQDRFHPQWPAIEGGARRRIAESGLLSLQSAAGARNSTDAFEAAVKQALAAGPVAVAVFITDMRRAEHGLSLIRATGVPVVSLGARTREPVGFAHVEVDYPGGAEQLGASLAEASEGRRSYILVYDDTDNDVTARQCYERFFTAAMHDSRVTLLEERAAQGLDATRAAVEDLVDRFRHVGVVVTLSPDLWLSRQPPFRLPEPHRFVTLSAAPALWPRLRNGEAAALAGPIDADIGREAMDLLLNALTKRAQSGVTKRVPCELVTPGLLDDFAARYVERAGLNIDELLPQAER